MSACFFDSSSLVKRYVNEAGSEWTQNITTPPAGNLLYISRITSVEVVAAISRRLKAGSIVFADAASAIAQFRQDLVQDYRIIELTPTIAGEAMQLAERHSLRGYDAVQLASAITIDRQVSELGVSSAAFSYTLISADGDLNAAAESEGLSVEDPNTYP